jgi:endogenous inhibitor of DNA gyrase (YacG/DUF329 family)
MASVDPQAPRATRRCPNCGKPASEQFRPFCSRRCADLDLHRWLSGSYAIPVTESEERPEDAAPGEAEETEKTEKH